MISYSVVSLFGAFSYPRERERERERERDERPEDTFVFQSHPEERETMATETVFEAKKVEEKYLAERTFQWLEGLTGDKLSGYGLGLGEVLRNGKVLKKVANIIEKSASGSSRRLSKGELTEERKGFQAILDVDYFLSCCRSLGLKDHQLFNASDVTTCGDLLRVCRTVRSLSLSCREKGIQVRVSFLPERERERERD